MANLIVDERDQLFVLREMLGIESLCKLERFQDHGDTDFAMVLREAHKLASAEFAPAAPEADSQGCAYDAQAKSVALPSCLHGPFQSYLEGGWLSMADDPEVGGQGLPLTMDTAVSEVFYAANYYLYGPIKLTHAAAKALETFGSPEQKAACLDKLYSGQWMGTMCLTEPQAGSDVGAVRTKAVPSPDGSYRLVGGKIFITGGEHDLSENIIHMVLARIEGDPPGTKGLSLFMVPKFNLNADGSLGTRNDVYCAGIEHKMGLHAMSTCSLVLGDSGQCVGQLLGERGQGIAEMFHMMNEQRLLVGVQGLAMSATAYLHAVDYAMERRQGNRPGSGEAVAILHHPDVKRMLLTLKAYSEGCRALAYFTSLCLDQASAAAQAERPAWASLAALLTPVVKAYSTDRAWEMTGTAIQCAGGYGYCSDYPFERLARDCKVSSLFEGTNGIQALDLVFRKLLRDDLAAFGLLMERMDQTTAQAREMPGLAGEAQAVASAQAGLKAAAQGLAQRAGQGGVEAVQAKTAAFLEAMGDVVLGWLHLWALAVAQPRLDEMQAQAGGAGLDQLCEQSSEAAFYAGKAAGARFFINTILARSEGKFADLASDPAPLLSMSPAVWGA